MTKATSKQALSWGLAYSFREQLHEYHGEEQTRKVQESGQELTAPLQAASREKGREKEGGRQGGIERGRGRQAWCGL